MDSEYFSRTELMIGDAGIKRLQQATIALFGLGGVGGYAAESLVRSGIGNLRIIDFDIISKSNFNRQIYALYSTLGRKKTEVALERLLDINPQLNITVYDMIFNKDSDNEVFSPPIDYIIDAIDSLNPKCELIERAVRLKIPIISAMGAASRTDDEQLKEGIIWDTGNCPLARKLRQRLRRRGLKDEKIAVIYSTEPPHGTLIPVDEHHDEINIGNGRKRPLLPSTAVLPAIVGLKIANKVISDLLEPLNIKYK